MDYKLLPIEKKYQQILLMNDRNFTHDIKDETINEKMIEEVMFIN